MYAVVEIGGFQYRVKSSDIVTVPLLSNNVGDEVSFTHIVAAGEGSNIRIGTPTLSGKVTAKVLGHGKAEKVVVFHKKRRKGYRKKNGHRQHYTQIQIGNIAVA